VAREERPVGDGERPMGDERPRTDHGSPRNTDATEAADTRNTDRTAADAAAETAAEAASTVESTGVHPTTAAATSAAASSRGQCRSCDQYGTDRDRCGQNCQFSRNHRGISSLD
jgi:hypothetical protein